MSEFVADYLTRKESRLDAQGDLAVAIEEVARQVKSPTSDMNVIQDKILSMHKLTVKSRVPEQLFLDYRMMLDNFIDYGRDPEATSDEVMAIERAVWMASSNLRSPLVRSKLMAAIIDLLQSVSKLKRMSASWGAVRSIKQRKQAAIAGGSTPPAIT